VAAAAVDLLVEHLPQPPVIEAAGESVDERGGQQPPEARRLLEAECGQRRVGVHQPLERPVGERGRGMEPGADDPGDTLRHANGRSCHACQAAGASTPGEPFDERALAVQDAPRELFPAPRRRAQARLR